MPTPAHLDELAFEEALSGFQADVTEAVRCFYAMAAINHMASDTRRAKC
jgi:hypothetical protein